MLNLRLLERFRALIISFVWFAASYFVMLPAFAQSSSAITVSGMNAQAMLANIVGQLPSLMKMITAIAYVMGIYFIIVALFKLKEFGESRTMMSQQHHLKEPLTYMAVGTLLLYLPSAVQATLSTFWAQPNPYGFLSSTGEYQDIWNDAMMVVQLFGTIAFIRGLIMLSHSGSHSQQGGLGKALTHIIGGIFCINIYQFIQVVFATLGISVSS